MTWSPPSAPLSAEQLQYLGEVDSPTIANAIERFGVRDRCDGFIGGCVRCLFPELGTMVGYALTVTMGNQPGPVADRAGFWRMFDTLAQMPAPSVLVVGDVSGAPERVAYCGEVMATLAQRLGAVGYVTDGGVRDLDEVRALGMHYFAAEVVVSHANFAILEVGAPVTLDGQEVRTGDLLHGDANGIVIVPTETVDGLPAAVKEVRDREREMMEFIRGPEFTMEGVKRLSGYR